MSAGTLNKLQGEFKQVCSEYDETKRKLAETENSWKQLKVESENKAGIMTDEIQRLNQIIEKKISEAIEVIIASILVALPYGGGFSQAETAQVLGCSMVVPDNTQSPFF